MEKLRTELVHKSNGTWRLRLLADTASHNEPQTRSIDDGDLLLDKLTEAGAQKLVIDLTAIDRVDSDGFRFLLNTCKMLSTKDIRIVLQNPGIHLQNLLRIMSFDHLFEIELGDV